MIINLIKSPIRTKKAFLLAQKNKYTFNVDLKLNKTQIKKIIQDVFKVQVTAVNTHRLPKKTRNLKTSTGYKSQYKRVIITVNTKI